MVIVMIQLDTCSRNGDNVGDIGGHLGKDGHVRWNLLHPSADVCHLKIRMMDFWPSDQALDQNRPSLHPGHRRDPCHALPCREGRTGSTPGRLGQRSAEKKIIEVKVQNSQGPKSKVSIAKKAQMWTKKCTENIVCFRRQLFYMEDILGRAQLEWAFS